MPYVKTCARLRLRFEVSEKWKVRGKREREREKRKFAEFASASRISHLIQTE